MGGFNNEVADLFSTLFQGTPLLPVVGGAGATAVADEAKPLQPGDAFGIDLINGDLSLGSTGTVTHVDGNRVYAFGHPFFNLGPTEFPMTKAYVHALLPSLFTSSKLASIGEIVGTIQQDRATAIAGTLGRGPELVPVKLTLAPERGPARSFNFEVAKDQMFTPLLTFASIVSIGLRRTRPVVGSRNRGKGRDRPRISS